MPVVRTAEYVVMSWLSLLPTTTPGRVEAVVSDQPEPGPTTRRCCVTRLLWAAATDRMHGPSGSAPTFLRTGGIREPAVRSDPVRDDQRLLPRRQGCPRTRYYIVTVDGHR